MFFLNNILLLLFLTHIQPNYSFFFNSKINQPIYQEEESYYKTLDRDFDKPSDKNFLEKLEEQTKENILRQLENDKNIEDYYKTESNYLPNYNIDDEKENYFENYVNNLGDNSDDLHKFEGQLLLKNSDDLILNKNEKNLNNLFEKIELQKYPSSNQENSNEVVNKIKENLDKEYDLNQLSKYLMAKRIEKNNENNENLNNKFESKINSEFLNYDAKTFDQNQENKKSEKILKEINKTIINSKNTPKVLTELKKTTFTNKDGKLFEKTETNKIISDLKDENEEVAQGLGSTLIVDPENSNYGKVNEQASMKNPIFLTQRDILKNVNNNHHKSRLVNFGDIYFIVIVVACSTVSILSVVGAGYCFYRYHQHDKATADVDYPAYGVIGPAFKSSQDEEQIQKEKKSPYVQDSLVDKTSTINHQSISLKNGSPIDRALAQSPQMYHYHHQKQQMISSDKNKSCRNTSNSDVETDEENEEGDYTVYECPGLASTGEIEINNPLFQHESLTPTKETKKP